MEVKSDEGTVVVADRNRYSDECCNRVVDAQRDQNIINSVVQALVNKTA